MSTFKGLVAEFPRIRIDYFRTIPDEPRPLACFLSHVHSDHLVGLDSFRTPFIYCTPATREMLLRLEKYPHRMNFAKGILESRKQTYRHLSKILKTIPLEVPTKILLAPDNQICVTLFDANHCVGSCMFLIQDESGRAILYTGDVRSETWFVNSLVQNPLLIPYTLGTKRLERIYLDTTFATKRDIYRVFPSKAEGIRELLDKVSRYPPDTTFHVQSWTFGYENVWIALSAATGSQLHVDDYKWRIYNSLTGVVGAGLPQPKEAAQMCGFMCGNHHMSGCLTNNDRVRIHSCEKGTECHTMKGKRDVVRIVPIVTRTKEGADVLEPGAGGGLGDLTQVHELELMDKDTVTQVMAHCALNIKDQDTLARVLKLLTEKLNADGGRVRLDTEEVVALDDDEGAFSLSQAIDIIRSTASNRTDEQRLANFPKTITFPYSRHSSYAELCELVAAFRPKDIYPCTVDDAHWAEDISMSTLFGEYCSDDIFAHDRYMRERKGLPPTAASPPTNPQTTQVAEDDPTIDRPPRDLQVSFDSQKTESDVDVGDVPGATDGRFQSATSKMSGGIVDLTTASFSQCVKDTRKAPIPISSSSSESEHTAKRRFADVESPQQAKPDSSRRIRQWAYDSAASLKGMSWETFGGIESARRAGDESQEL